ncbi:phosphoserine phosphatase SerB, partial [Undibacterium sp. CCC2.1]|nr:phosphoserine phosphatase SerB [Undibacterium sp. CCC2.1]
MGTHAVRLDNLRCDKELNVLKAQIEADCLAAHLDVTFSDVSRTLADFKLVAMDMDSTLITIECIDEIADMQGLKPQVS